MSPPGKKHRSARLRKKLHISEFQEFGFEFKTNINESLTELEIELLCYAFLSEVVEPRGLGMGGWITSAYLQSVTTRSATNEDRDTVRAWLEARPEFISFHIDPLTDAWYPPASK